MPHSHGISLPITQAQATVIYIRATRAGGAIAYQPVSVLEMPPDVPYLRVGSRGYRLQSSIIDSP